MLHCRRVSLQEKLTYRQLFQLSEPKRVVRSNTVRGPQLDFEAYEGVTYYFFNFKSSPSTTGSRQKGYIKFFKPKHAISTLDQVECSVDCTCPDFKFRWAWANKQRGSSQVGFRSVNKSLDRAPRITNPGSRPGLCKHLLALRNYIFGSLARFPGTGTDASDRLSKLVQMVQQQQHSAKTAPMRSSSKGILVKRDNDRAAAKKPSTASTSTFGTNIGDVFGQAEKRVPSLSFLRNRQRSRGESVDIGKEQAIMTIDLKNSIKILQEMEQDIEQSSAPLELPNLPTESEPAMSPSLAPSSQNVVDLLAGIKNLLQNLVALSEKPAEPDVAPDYTGDEVPEPDIESKEDNEGQENDEESESDEENADEDSLEKMKQAKKDLTDNPEEK